MEEILALLRVIVYLIVGGKALYLGKWKIFIVMVALVGIASTTSGLIEPGIRGALQLVSSNVGGFAVAYYINKALDKGAY